MKHKLNGLDMYVIFSIIVILAFTVFEFLSDRPHDVLTTCFYACFGGEILYCALIKIFKLRNDHTAEGEKDHDI